MADSDPDRLDRLRRTADRIRLLDGHERLVAGVRAVRRRLPGDDLYGDELSTAGEKPSDALGRGLVAFDADRPSALRELGLGALQAWQGLAERQGRGHGHREMALLFTDLAGFSDWALKSGDDAVVRLLRTVSAAVEPEVKRERGRVVKRLGDGLLATFTDPAAAVRAALAAQEALEDVEVDGHRPLLRAGVHVGTPRALGGDVLGVDVNIAARVMAEARPGTVLVSESVQRAVGDPAFELRRAGKVRAKGVPRDLEVWRARRRA